MWKNARTVEEGVLRNWDVTGVCSAQGSHTVVNLWTWLEDMLGEQDSFELSVNEQEVYFQCN